MLRPGDGRAVALRLCARDSVSAHKLEDRRLPGERALTPGEDCVGDGRAGESGRIVGKRLVMDQQRRVVTARGEPSGLDLRRDVQQADGEPFELAEADGAATTLAATTGHPTAADAAPTAAVQRPPHDRVESRAVSRPASAPPEPPPHPEARRPRHPGESSCSIAARTDDLPAPLAPVIESSTSSTVAMDTRLSRESACRPVGSRPFGDGPALCRV